MRWVDRLLLIAILLSLAGCRFLARPIPTPTSAPTEPPTTRSPSLTAVPLTPGTTLEAPPRPTPPPLEGEQILTLAGPPEGFLTLDPALVRDVDSAFLVQQLFRGLVRFDRDLHVVPELAERIELAPDGRTYTVVLRPDLTFHDGSPISTADVKYSFERASDPRLAGGNGRQLPAWNVFRDVVGGQERLLGRRPDIPGLEVVDDRTLRIHLVGPRPTFLLRLALPAASVIQRTNVEGGHEWWRRPVGSGPFRLLRWTDEEIVLGAYPGYRPGPPYLREVHVRIGTGALSPLNRYERGELDVAPVSIWDLDRISAPDSPYREHLIAQPLLAGTYVFFNPALPPLDDPEVRRALIQAFPREKVAQVTLRGHVEIADAILPSAMPGGPWRAALPAYDPVAARAVLAGRSLHLEVASAGSELPVMLARVWQQELGATVEVLQYDWPDYLADLDARRLPIVVLSWVADYPDPEAILDALFARESPFRPIEYDNPVVQLHLARARSTLDPVERRAELSAAQDALLADGVVLPLTFDVEYLVVAPRVRDWPLSPLGILGLERVWIDHTRDDR